MHARPSTENAEEEVAEEAYGDRHQRDNQDIEEHTNGIYLHLFARQPEHEQRRYDRRKERRDGRHAYGKRHVTLAKVRHDIARNASRTASYEYYTHDDRLRYGDAEIAYAHRQRPCYQRHERELCAGANEDVERACRQDLHILHRQRQSHGEHDEAQDARLHGSVNPREEVWHKISHHCNGNDEPRCVCCEPVAATK